MNKYDVESNLGEGAYGIVLRCRNKETNEVVAVKKFKESDDDEIVKKTSMRELAVLKVLRHPHIINLKEAFKRKGRLYLVFGFAQQNVLQTLENNPNGLTPKHVQRYTSHLVQAIAFCHSHNILHRDIKPENLLIADGDILKLCDFGFARGVDSETEPLTEYVATRWYRAPELLVGGTYSKPNDMWAVACIAAELAAGHALFMGESDIDQLYIIQRIVGPVPRKLSPYFKKKFGGMSFPASEPITLRATLEGKMTGVPLNFLENMLIMDVEHRLTGTRALKHPYLADGHKKAASPSLSRASSATRSVCTLPRSAAASPHSSSSRGSRAGGSRDVGGGRHVRTHDTRASGTQSRQSSGKEGVASQASSRGASARDPGNGRTASRTSRRKPAVSSPEASIADPTANAEEDQAGCQTPERNHLEQGTNTGAANGASAITQKQGSNAHAPRPVSAVSVSSVSTTSVHSDGGGGTSDNDDEDQPTSNGASTTNSVGDAGHAKLEMLEMEMRPMSLNREKQNQRCDAQYHRKSSKTPPGKRIARTLK